MIQADRTDPRGLTTAIVLAAVIAAFLMALMPATMLWDRDEPLYARTAIEMLLSGNFLVPTFNGEVFAHKPPFVYWMIAASIAVFGESEFAARFIAAPFMAAAAFITFLIGRRMHSPQAGLWAMVVLTTTILTVYLGSAVMLDPALLFFICLALYAYVGMVYAERPKKRLMALFFIAVLLSIFVKGPVGPVVIGLTVLVSWLAMERGQRPPFWSMLVLAGLSVVAFLIFLAWLIPADARTGGEMLRTGVGYHIIDRAFTPLEGHGGGRTVGWFGTLPYYIPVVLVGFFPWVLYLPGALAGLVRGELGTRRERAIVLGWMAPTFILFTLAATKLPHYILPIFPAFALAVGLYIARLSEGGAPRYLKTGLVMGVVVAVLLALGVVVAPFVVPADLTVVRALPFAVGIVGVMVGAWVLMRRGRFGLANKVVALGIPVVLMYLLWSVIPAVEPVFKISRPLGQALQAHASPTTEIWTVGYSEPSLVFYASPSLDRPLRSIPHNADASKALSEVTGDVLVIATREVIEGANALVPHHPFQELDRVAAWNTNRGGEFQEVILARRSARMP